MGYGRSGTADLTLEFDLSNRDEYLPDAAPPFSTSTTASLQASLVAYAAISRLAVADTGIDQMLQEICEELAGTLDDGRCGVFEDADDHLRLWAGTGWDVGTVLDVALPIRWELRKIPAPVRSLSDCPTLAAALRPEAPSLEAHGWLAPISVPEGRDAVLIVACSAPMEPDSTFSLVQLTADLITGGWARRSLDQQLRASGQRLVEAQELAHMGSYDWNITTDTNLWSDELYRIYGHEPQSFNASYDRFLSLLEPECRDDVIAVHQQAYATGEPYRMRERIIRPDGEVRTLESTGEVILDDHGRPVRMRGVCIDITDRLRVEAELDRFEQADRRRRHALEINDNVVQGLTAVMWNLEQNDADMAQDIAGRTLDAARNMMSRLLEVNGELDPTELVRTGSAASMRTPSEAMPVHAARDGERTRPDLRDTATIALVDDSTDIRLLLSAQLCTRGDIEVVAEGGTGAEAVRIADDLRPNIMLLDIAMPDGDGLSAIPGILSASPLTRVVVLSGFSTDLLADQALSAGAVAYVEKGAFDALTTVLDEQIQILGFSREATPTIDDHPDVMGIRGSGDLRTDVGHLVHELRTPVTVIGGLAQLFQRERDSLTSATTGELIDTLVRNTTHLRDLLDRISGGYLLPDDLRYERCEIVDLINRVATDLRPVLAGHAVVVTGDPVHAEVDPLRFSQVITNLLTNASRYAPGDSAIAIEVDVIEDAGRNLRVTVTDEGAGVADELIDTIFDPFVHERTPDAGLGLGLHISSLIAKAHGGALLLVTPRGPGTQFALTLPLARTVGANH